MFLVVETDTRRTQAENNHIASIVGISLKMPFKSSGVSFCLLFALVLIYCYGLAKYVQNRKNAIINFNVSIIQTH